MKLALVLHLSTDKAQTVTPELARLSTLETLMARGDAFAPPLEGCERSVFVMLGFDPATADANAAIFALADGLTPGTEYWLRADPVCIVPTAMQLTLQELPQNTLSAAEATALSNTLTAHFGTDAFVLYTPHPQRWYLRLRDAPDLHTLPPAACAGTLKESDLPTGRDSAQWKRMITEAQMLLHAHPVNEAREAQGLMPANAIWPWGGGRAPIRTHEARYNTVFSDDLLARGVARAAGIAAHPVPDDLNNALAASRDGDDLLVYFPSVITSGSAAQALEHRWIRPLRTALEQNRLAELSIIVGRADTCIARRVTRTSLGRWWRRKRALQHYG